jgi:hypothetical protein
MVWWYTVMTDPKDCRDNAVHCVKMANKALGFAVEPMPLAELRAAFQAFDGGPEPRLRQPCFVAFDYLSPELSCGRPIET